MAINRCTTNPQPAFKLCSLHPKQATDTLWQFHAGRAGKRVLERGWGWGLIVVNSGGKALSLPQSSRFRRAHIRAEYNRRWAAIDPLSRKDNIAMTTSDGSRSQKGGPED
ncbi:hypothetical protein AAFF_G00249430 [Aldrovandia affinis]|uniref:Uncharacterized protein n=1 Tax=Aldrovandia affinis TaxID=143900 RepID=A0AAD7W3E0_9TELE|nr:hypothetical protein AAFF_G00249430 [Aldrovandia affinis]